MRARWVLISVILLFCAKPALAQAPALAPPVFHGTVTFDCPDGRGTSAWEATLLRGILL